MRTFNRVLYVACAVCVALTAVLLLVAMWAEVDGETFWKVVGSSAVLTAASGIMLAINFLLLKLENDATLDEGSAEAPPPPAS